MSPAQTLASQVAGALMRSRLMRVTTGGVLTLVGLAALLSALGFGGGLLGVGAGLLRQVLGVGAPLVALVLIGVGVHLALGKPFHFRRRQWAQLIFAEVAFLAFLALLHALIPDRQAAYQAARTGQGGGAVGWVLAELLWRALGVPREGGASLLHGLAVLIWGSVTVFCTLVVVSPLLSALGARQQPSARAPSSVRAAVERHARASQAAAPQPAEPQPAVPEPRPTTASLRQSVGSPAQPRAASATAKRGRAVAPASQPLERQSALPPLSLLRPAKSAKPSDADIKRQAEIIETTLAQFGLSGRVVEIRSGPTVTQFGVEPGYVERGSAQSREKLLHKLQDVVAQAIADAITLEMAFDRTSAQLIAPAAIVEARESSFRKLLRALLADYDFSLTVHESDARNNRIAFELGADTERKAKLKVNQLTGLHRSLVAALADNLVRFDAFETSDMLTERLRLTLPLGLAEAIGLQQRLEDALVNLGLSGRVEMSRRNTQVLIEWQRQAQKVRVSAIAALQNDLALALAAPSIRIEAPIPGRGLVGIEVPNPTAASVDLRSLMESDAFRQLAEQTPLALALGRDVSGAPICTDLARMPHLLIAGTTGSGKSVAISAMIVCLAMNNRPEALRLVMIDPKMVELSRFAGLPHLLGKPESSLERIPAVLRWVSREMDARYRQFAELGARSIQDYNEAVALRQQAPLPRIVVFIDELADLMLQAPIETEKTICRLAQMARATGIHLVVATQRPSVDVVTGLIKANFPARISFAVATATDSRVILDQAGAESLLGRGDMLFLDPERSAPIRLQGCFVGDKEIEDLVRWWQRAAEAEQALQPAVSPQANTPWEGLVAEVAAERQHRRGSHSEASADDDDDLLQRAMELVRTSGNVSTSLLQRRLRIGYPRAARLMEELQAMGYVGGRTHQTGKSRSANAG
ncbi:MAG: DNA translocase FtsK [Thermoflexales bacterium]|nr:DNA translocase FtsK [Thermoflexales bacterium]